MTEARALSKRNSKCAGGCDRNISKWVTYCRWCRELLDRIKAAAPGGLVDSSLTRAELETARRLYRHKLIEARPLEGSDTPQDVLFPVGENR